MRILFITLDGCTKTAEMELPKEMLNEINVPIYADMSPFHFTTIKDLPPAHTRYKIRRYKRLRYNPLAAETGIDMVFVEIL